MGATSMTSAPDEVSIRIYHECEDGIEKKPPEDDHLASQGLASDDIR